MAASWGSCHDSTTSGPTDDVTPSGHSDEVTLSGQSDFVTGPGRDDVSTPAGDGPDDFSLASAAGQDMLQEIGDHINLLSQDMETNFLAGNSEVTADSERSLYVETPALQEADSILQETGVVILSGFPGTGKTTLAHALLRRCRREGFKSYMLRKIEDWDSHVGQHKHCVVLLDGNFGRVQLDSQQHDSWKQIVGTVLALIKQGTCRLIITVYPHVLHQLQVMENHPNSPLQNDNAVVHLTDTLPRDVKEKLLQFHLETLCLDTERQWQVVQTVLRTDRSGPAFPWCCQHMVSHWRSSEDPTAVFQLPAEAYAELFKDMVLHSVHGRVFAAVLALSMRGVFYYLHRLAETEHHLQDLGFTQYCVHELAGCAFNLQGSILFQGGFSSRVLYEAAGLALGRFFRLPTLLKVCDTLFLVQYVRCASADQGSPACITVGSTPSCSLDPEQCADDCQALVKRMYRELFHGNRQLAAQHTCLHCHSFLMELGEYMHRIYRGRMIVGCAYVCGVLHRLLSMQLTY